MDDFRRYGFVALGLILVIGDVSLRAWYGKEVGVSVNDLALLVLPFLLWLLASGEIQSLKVGAGGLEVKSAVQRAARSSIAGQVESLPIHSLQIDPKGALGDLELIIERQPQALSFTIRKEPWHDPYVASQYITRLSKTPNFKYFVFLNDRDQFIGAIEATALARALGLLDGDNAAQPGAMLSLTQFIPIVNGEEPEGPLLGIPGFVDQAAALTRNSNKQTALARMEEADLPWLPVIDSRTKRLLGIVEQSKIATSLILDLTRALVEPSPTGNRRRAAAG